MKKKTTPCHIKHHSKFKIDNDFLQNDRILIIKIKIKFQLIIKIINYLLNT